ncbi:hypothetical protein [Salinibacter sp.]|uniref:hypothetical protein n=1 Tax=Salinibacter sp. TaxID=2065818 RepID=UPI0035D3EE5B
MPMFPPDGFPYVFECECGTKAQVTYAEAAETAREDWVARKAINHVLTEKHGWGETKGGKRCEECITAKSTPKP